ncbi:aldo/keto reductase [Mobilicoccus massiliensis]|uniref:aldo/keto reductase n=1 Tax=Mobilicoccus massiliensis TaxID=1522310 RepID=UPI00058CE840|nr:aldo/keto reductase [Mobilicoccus massiliensis]
MRTRTIGNDEIGRHEVGAVGLGLMTMNQDGEPPRDQLLDTVRAALDAGVTLFDTADAYGHGIDGASGMGQNETLVAGLLDELGVRSQVLLATKGGHVRTEGGGWELDSSPEHLRRAVDDSLARLRVQQIALWQLHRPDPTRDFTETLEVVRDIAESGKIDMVGVSNVDPTQIRIARDVLGSRLVSVQNQFNPRFRSSADEIALCAELGLAFLAWSPLGGLNEAKQLAEQHPAFAEIADERGVSPQQVALAWELAQAPVVIPIPGAKRPQSITDSAAAAAIDLTDEELARLDTA